MSTIKSSDEHLTLNADGSSKDIKLQSNASEKVIVKSDGKVGIGTSSPDVKLHITDSQEQLTLSEGGSKGTTFDYRSSTGNLNIATNGINARTSPQFTLDLNGKVGIGTASPSYKLDVDAGAPSSADKVISRHMSETSRQLGLVWDDSASTLGLATLTNHSLAFHTNGINPRMLIDSSGAVTMPSQPCASFGWSSDISANSVIPANLIRVNTGSHLNSSGRFTAPVAGTYWYGYVGMSHNNTNNFKVELLKNGSLNGNDTRAFTHDVAYSQNSIFGFITLSANDYLEFKPQNVTLHSNYGQISIKLVA